MKVALSMNEIGQNIKQNLERMISKQTEGKCIAEGFIRPNSIQLINYSSGVITNDFIEFQTVFECMVCYPVEGMLMECNAKTITKAGIHAEVTDEDGNIRLACHTAAHLRVCRHHGYNARPDGRLRPG